MTVGLFIAGQILASLGLDTLGILGVPQRPLAAAMLLGALAVLAGAVAIVFGQKGAAAELSLSKLGWTLLALIAGAVLPGRDQRPVAPRSRRALSRRRLGITAAVVSFTMLTLALKALPVGTAYAVWVGIGAAGVALAGIIALGESASPLRLGLLALILIGVIGLKFIEA